MKGRARKAKSKAGAGGTSDNTYVDIEGDSMEIITSHVPNPNNSNCTHGAVLLPDVCIQFMTSFFKSFTVDINLHKIKSALKDASDKFPDAVNNDTNREIFKKTLVCNGVLSLLQTRWADSFGCAAAFMYIDSYASSSLMSPGVIDQRDAKVLMTNLDIISGCRRSLVKFYVNRIPCKCLDELYSRVRSTTTKMGICSNCKETKARSSLYLCTGCERIDYCSKACQLADVPNHKKFCKGWQMYDAI